MPELKYELSRTIDIVTDDKPFSQMILRNRCCQVELS